MTDRAFNSKKLLALALQFAFLFAFVIVAIIFSVNSPTFLTGGNLLNLVEGSVVLLLVALGMTLVITTGGIDLSVGVALDFGAWLSLVSMMAWGVPWPIAVLIGLAGGALIGVLNAFLIVKLGVSPFLATLGTYFIGRSVEQVGTGGGASISFRRAPEPFRALAQGDIFGIPNEVFFGIAAIVVFFLVIHRSAQGIGLRSMGLQDSAAVVAGVPTKRYRAIALIASSVVCALAGILLSSGLRLFTPNAGFSYLMDAIAAVFIGASMHPRQRPNVLGTLVGVLFLTVVSNGLDLMGLDFNLKAALRGAVLILALSVAYLVAKQSMRLKGR